MQSKQFGLLYLFTGISIIVFAESNNLHSYMVSSSLTNS